MALGFVLEGERVRKRREEIEIEIERDGSNTKSLANDFQSTIKLITQGFWPS